MRSNNQLWRVKSKGAILILVLHFLVCSAFSTLLWLLLEAYYQGHATPLELYLSTIVASFVLVVSCPTTGWLADVYFGRYKVLQFGLWVMWAGVLTMAVTSLLLCTFEQHQTVFKSTGGLVGVALASIGLSAYIVNVVQFGIDQMPDASSDELSAYIHWFVWVFFAGQVIGGLTYLIRYCVPIASSTFATTAAIQLMVPMVALSIALCCMFLLREWLIIEPGSANALKTIVRVLKFAAVHKYPIRRRAITYSEDEKPSRIDFAKDKYGGPYTTEQVEDVKTFFRIVVVVTSTTTIVIPFFLFQVSLGHLETLTSHQVCVVVSRQTAYTISAFAFMLIPLNRIAIHPLIRKRLPSMLVRVTVAAALSVIMSGTVLIIDSIKHALDPDIVCMFESGPEVDQMLKPDLWMIIPLRLFMAIGVVIYLTAIFEFVCAQSPYAMRGLLTGLLCAIMFFVYPVAVGIFYAWSNFQRQISPSCDFYYFLFQFLCAAVGLTVQCTVTRWYKRRQREEEDDQRRIVEGIYDRLLSNRYGALVNAGGDD